MKITRREEFLISNARRKEIHQLLIQCFPEYPKDQSYYKQLPDFRLLAYTQEELIGHLAVEHRLININGTPSRIFGVADLCISPAYQSKNIASSLLQNLEALAKKSEIEFIILISDENDFYKKNGFQLVNNTCRWLMINEHKSFGIAHRRIESCLMIKALGKRQWEEGTIDFLGHIF